jgi:transposase InsO family protein
MSRANYYKQRVVRQRQAVDEQLVVDLVRRERARQPMLGGRKLWRLLEPELGLAGVSLGRDRLFDVLKRHNLLIARRRRGARTTNSRHGFRMYPNLACDLVPTGPQQLWVSDITSDENEASSWSDIGLHLSKPSRGGEHLDRGMPH